jgi:hypothetical protein
MDSFCLHAFFSIPMGFVSASVFLSTLPVAVPIHDCDDFLLVFLLVITGVEFVFVQVDE